MNKNINVSIYQNICICIFSRFTYSMINWDPVVYIYIETTQLLVIHSSTNNYINVIKYLMLQHIRLPALIKE